MPLYVNLSKPLVFIEFERNKSLLGWLRIDLLINRLNTDQKFKDQFTKTELLKIDKKFIVRKQNEQRF